MGATRPAHATSDAGPFGRGEERRRRILLVQRCTDEIQAHAFAAGHVDGLADDPRAGAGDYRPDLGPLHQCVEVDACKHRVEVDPIEHPVDVYLLDHRVHVDPCQQQVQVGPSQDGVDVHLVDELVDVDLFDQRVEVNSDQKAVEVGPGQDGSRSILASSSFRSTRPSTSCTSTRSTTPWMSTRSTTSFTSIAPTTPGATSFATDCKTPVASANNSPKTPGRASTEALSSAPSRGHTLILTRRSCPSPLHRWRT